MITTSNLGKSYGDQTLFEGVSLQLTPGNRYGLVGANGSGKTTFLNILCGTEQPSDGDYLVSKGSKLGVLKQDRFLNDEQRILDVAMMADPVWKSLKEYDELTAAHATDVHRLTELQEHISAAGGYTLESRAATVLIGLGIEQSALDKPLSTLSGGFRLRTLLAQVLVSDPDILLLDEPTNHLDILSIRWLEKFLATYRGCAVVISHDLRFLDNVATHILDVDYRTVTQYTGNYTAFVEQKRAHKEQKERELDKAEKIIAEKRAFVERFKAKATKARQAQSRLKQIERIEVVDVPKSTRRTPKFSFVPARPSGKQVLSLEGIAKSYGKKQVLSGVDVTIRRGERLAVIGENGLGKSTLLKIAVAALAPDSGKIDWGHEARVGYFAQDHRDLFPNPNQTALEYLWSTCPTETTSYVRGRLGQVLFSGKEVEKRVHQLSGGEAARLIFARLAAEQPNVLVLDEPTNHLDIESIEALVEALTSFEGTVLFVSHDRWVVSHLATRILEITKEGPRDFLGTYAEYLAQCGDDHLDADLVAQKAKAAKAAATEAPKLSREDQKRLSNRNKTLPKKRDDLVGQIEAGEARKRVIQERYCQPNFFEKTPAAEVAALQAEEAKLDQRLALLLAEWEKIEAELEALG